MNAPPHKYSDRDADGLTTCIVDYLKLSGHSGMRSAGPGTYRSDAVQFIPSEQRDGFPMVFAVVDGRAVFVEVKIGADRLSNVQKATIIDLIRAGASVYVARHFIGFLDWFTTLLPTLTNADALPFGPAPRDYN